MFTPTPLKMIRMLAMICLLCLVAGCSAVKLSYNNAPDLMYWWLDGYVNFSAKQKPLVKQQLTNFQNWHRQNELPKYVEFLQRINQLASDNVAPQQICSLFDTAKIRAQAFNTEIVPILQTISPDLSTSQLQHIEKKFAENNEEWREKWIDDKPEKLQKKRLEDAIDRAESFYGNLSRVQKDLLLSSIQTSSFNPETSYQRRLKNQQKLLALLRAIQQVELSAEQANMQLQAFMRQMTEPDDADYAAYMDKLSTESCQTLANLHNSSTSKQRKNLHKNLQGYLNDFNTLITGQN